MLVPGIRLIERPGALHLFDGRRVVSITGDENGRAAIRTAIGTILRPDGEAEGEADSAPDDTAVDDARRMLAELRLIVADREPATPATGERHRSPDRVAADYVSAASAGWVPASRAAQRLHRVTVHVLTSPNATAADGAATATETPEARLLGSLTATGIRTRRLRTAGDIAQLDPDRDIVAALAPDDDPAGALRTANDACVRANIPLLPIGGYDGLRLHVGPLIIPHQSACLDCTLRRAGANVAYPELFDAVLGAPVAPTPPALREWAAATASLILLRWIGDGDVRLPGRLFNLVPDELRIRQAVVYRVPRCRVCAAPDFEVRAAPWEPARDH